MKRILVPCDFSKQSLEALKMAVGIATQSGGTITVLHLLYIPSYYDPNFVGNVPDYDPVLFTTMDEDARKTFEQMRKRLGDISPRIEFETQVGGLVECVKRRTREKGIDLVVMGTSGSSGFQEFVVGSNTEKIVRFSEVPVLAVRTASAINTVKRILLPTTGALDQATFISNLKEVQHFFNATLHILLINTPTAFRRDAEGLEILTEFVRHYHLENFELHFRSYHDEDEGIIDFAHLIKADLVAMATHSRKGLSHLFRGSIAEDVVNHIYSPVWTYSVGK